MKTLSRRRFLKNSFAASLAGAGGMMLNMQAANAMLSQSSQRLDGYKALVCVFLYGGNDSYNLLVPTAPTDYQVYQSVRQNLAFPRESLLALSPSGQVPYAFGMPEQASALHSLVDSGQAAIVANVGPLPRPLTKAEILNDLSLLPPQLFSHNDQQSLWQSANLNTRSQTGWAGRMADLVMDSNDSLPMNMSLFGNNLLLTGTGIQPFSLNSEGPETFIALDPEQSWNRQRIDVFSRLLGATQHPLAQEYASVINSANVNNGRIVDALEMVEPVDTNYPLGNDLAAQLSMVANLISVNQVLGQSRQVFFVGMGGWDTHDAQTTLHPQLLAGLGSALQAFQDELNQRNLADSVTTFTLSEFGRTLTSNGDGTDHGWGGHQLVMGGAVSGNRVYGQLPALELNSNDDLDSGRMIPTLSIEQYGATLARWFGLSDTELTAVFPSLGLFDQSDLGFMQG